MTYREAIDFLYGLQLFGAALGLETTRQLAQAVGDPQDRLRFIHVAGTNGKGSTCAALASIYKSAGLRVGLYTSPHLVSFRERMQVNGQLISEEQVAAIADEVRSGMRALPVSARPTFFEVVTVMALRWFSQMKCDLVIWETGLGGRLDATNIVRPLASVITNVQLDHEKWLGDTIVKIAREKAGIIKPGVPVVTAADDPAALEVIRQQAESCGAPLHMVEPKDVAAQHAFALHGEHQRRNAAVAARTVQVLQAALSVTDAARMHGLANTLWPGRFQRIRTQAGMMVLDGAHNPAGARALAETVLAEFPNQRRTLIIGVLNDKNWSEVCHLLAPLAQHIIVAPVSSPRSASTADLAAACHQSNAAALVEVSENVAAALAKAKSDPVVIVTGSLYFVGEVMTLVGIAVDAPGERQLNEWSQPAQSVRP